MDDNRITLFDLNAGIVVSHNDCGLPRRWIPRKTAVFGFTGSAVVRFQR